MGWSKEDNHTHTCRERPCQCVRWTLTAISNSLIHITMEQFAQNLLFEPLFLPKDDASVFWWSNNLFQASLRPPRTHTREGVHERAAAASLWQTEAAGASGVKGHSFSPKNKTVVWLWTNNSIYQSFLWPQTLPPGGDLSLSTWAATRIGGFWTTAVKQFWTVVTEDQFAAPGEAHWCTTMVSMWTWD